MTIATVTDGRAFQVLVSHRVHVQASLEALSKRYARRGLALAPWSWGKAYSRLEHTSNQPCCIPRTCCSDCHNIARIPLTLTGEPPCYKGWSFVAALTHIEGETVVRTVPGQEVPVIYRTRGAVCDHCRVARRRSETYVLRHEDGRLVQVGSTCIGDFLGADVAGDLAAAAATLYAAARGIAEDGCEGMGGGSGETTLGEYLPFVAWCVREQGWTSRTAARERGDASATADRAMTYLSDPKIRKEAGCDPTADDVALAGAAEAWAEAITDETIAADRGDYLHNLRVVARSGLVVRKTAGIAASMIVAYQRHLGRERAKIERAARPVANVHVGTVGKRETWGPIVLDFVTGYETDYGYTTVLKFRTVEGATIVWKASSTDLERADVGKTFTLTGTVKKHDEYKGEKQTIVSRCRVEAVVQIAIEAESRALDQSVQSACR
jgi:hypothetical protein